MLRMPWSSRTAEFQTSRRPASTLVAMSAIMNWIAWCIAIGTPNWTLSLEYSVANSKRGAADADGHRRDAGTGAVEGHHRQLEALVFLAEQVLGRDLDFVEGDGRGVGGPLAHLVLLLVDGDPGEVGVDDEGADPAVAGLGVGLGVDREVVGVGAVGDEALGAVDDVLVALLDGAGLHPGDVGAGVGLGQAEGGELRLLGRASRGTSSSSPRSRRG